MYTTRRVKVNTDYNPIKLLVYAHIHNAIPQFHETRESRGIREIVYQSTSFSALG